MALTDKLTAIADAIRAKTGGTEPLTLAEMPSEIEGIQTGITPTGTINISENGTYDVTDYAEAFVETSSGVSFTFTVECTDETYLEHVLFVGAPGKNIIVLPETGVQINEYVWVWDYIIAVCIEAANNTASTNTATGKVWSFGGKSVWDGDDDNWVQWGFDATKKSTSASNDIELSPWLVSEGHSFAFGRESSSSVYRMFSKVYPFLKGLTYRVIVW